MHLGVGETLLIHIETHLRQIETLLKQMDYIDKRVADGVDRGAQMHKRVAAGDG